MKILSDTNRAPHKLAIALVFASVFASSCSTTNTNENANVASNARTINANASAPTTSIPTNPVPANAASTNTAANVSRAPITTNANSAQQATVNDSSSEPPVDPDTPSDAEIQTLVKTTLLDFNSAVQSGSFDSFHSSASNYFQQQFTPAQLEQKNADFIRRKFDFSQISNKQAALTQKIENRNGIKILLANGSYPTNPPINFQLQYIQEDIEWKLSAIEVEVK